MDAEARTKPTLAAVAARAGVSSSTASLAFSGAGPVSEETKARVLAAAEELHYAGPDPRAASLRRGRSGIIGVVMDDRLSDAFRDPVNIAMLDGLADELGRAGCGLLLMTGDRTNMGLTAVDAVVLFGCTPRLDDAVATFRLRGIPLVTVEADAEDGVVDIGLDNREATRVIAQHVRDLGHEDVALVTLPVDGDRAPGVVDATRERRADVHTAVERLRGARDVFPQAVAFAATGSYVEAGEVAGRALLDAARRPTAILAQSDLLAVGVINAAEERGLRVPDDLSVVGFDGIPLAGVDLTTMVQPSVAKGRAAGSAALALADGQAATSVAFASEFHRGATTAPPRR
jgi:DNA-binding LacI/PurR family transcriptional regulator